MNPKDRFPQRPPFNLMAAIAPLAVALALVGCQAKPGDEATDSMNNSADVPPATTADGAPMRYAEDMNGKDVTVAPGAEFEIALASDPSNGMIWAWVDSTSSAITLLDRSLMDRDEHAAGTDAAGMVTVWRFRAPTTGTAPVRLELRGPGEATAAQSYVVTVHAG